MAQNGLKMALRRAQDGPGWAQDGRDKNPEIGRMSSSRQQNTPRLVVCLLSGPTNTSNTLPYVCFQAAIKIPKLAVCLCSRQQQPAAAVDVTSSQQPSGSNQQQRPAASACVNSNQQQQPAAAASSSQQQQQRPAIAASNNLSEQQPAAGRKNQQQRPATTSIYIGNNQ